MKSIKNFTANPINPINNIPNPVILNPIINSSFEGYFIILNTLRYCFNLNFILLYVSLNHLDVINITEITPTAKAVNGLFKTNLFMSYYNRNL